MLECAVPLLSGDWCEASLVQGLVLWSVPFLLQVVRIACAAFFEERQSAVLAELVISRCPVRLQNVARPAEIGQYSLSIGVVL